MGKSLWIGEWKVVGKLTHVMGKSGEVWGYTPPAKLSPVLSTAFSPTPTRHVFRKSTAPTSTTTLIIYNRGIIKEPL